MLVPHRAILAEAVITLWVAGQRPVALLVAVWRRNVCTRHALQTLTVLSLLTLLPLKCCTLPRPVDGAAIMSAVQPVHRHGARSHLMPRLAVNG